MGSSAALVGDYGKTYVASIDANGNAGPLADLLGHCGGVVSWSLSMADSRAGSKSNEAAA